MEISVRKVYGCECRLYGFDQKFKSISRKDCAKEILAEGAKKYKYRFGQRHEGKRRAKKEILAENSKKYKYNVTQRRKASPS